jgi:hypothetical protein
MLLKKERAMMRIFVMGTFLLLIGMAKKYGMELNTALKLVQAWGQDSKDMKFIGELTVDARGGFLTKSAGAFFRYDPPTKRLLVSGLVRYNVTIHSEFPDTWKKWFARPNESRQPSAKVSWNYTPKNSLTSTEMSSC